MLKKLIKRKGEEGFTLVELLIVVAIIAILAAIAIPQFSKYKLRSYKSKIDSDAKNVYTAAQAYLTDYPTDTVDSTTKLLAGGFKASPSITVSSASMTTAAGVIELTTADPLTDNNAVIHFNGRIDYPNAP